MVGVELNPVFAELSQKTLAKHKMDNRCEVICSDIRAQKELLAKADVVIFNNVFDAFMPKDIQVPRHTHRRKNSRSQVELYRFLLESISKPDCRIIAYPAFEVSLKSLGVRLILLPPSWLNTFQVPPAVLDPLSFWKHMKVQLDDLTDEEEEEMDGFVHYAVKKR